MEFSTLNYINKKLYYDIILEQYLTQLIDSRRDTPNLVYVLTQKKQNFFLKIELALKIIL